MLNAIICRFKCALHVEIAECNQPDTGLTFEFTQLEVKEL